MPYKSKAKRRIYQRELMRRRRGSNITGESKYNSQRNVRPDVRPSPQETKRRAGKGDDLRTDLPGGEAMWGFEETT